MSNPSKYRPERLGKLLAWWVCLVQRTAFWVVLLSTLATGVILYFTVKNLEINTNLDTMLSKNLSFRRTYEDYQKAFPQDISTILLVIDGDTPDLAQDASKALAARLRKETRLFKSVYLPGGDRFFEENALLYLTVPELEDLSDHLARVQPFLAKLVHDPSVRGFFSLLSSVVEASKEEEEFEFTPLFERLAKVFHSILHQQPHQFSWLELIQGQPSTPDERRRFIIVEPWLDFSKLYPAEPALKAVHRLARDLKIDRGHGVKMRVTGDIALDHEELQTISRGAAIATVLSFVLVVILLLIAYDSLWLVLATLLTLIYGLIWTTGFAVFVVGHLNLFSVVFAALYIGMAVDFSIHFCLRYRELLQSRVDGSEALSETALDIGHSLIVGGFILVIGFYAFLPTAFVGVSELGLITGTGMFIGLFATLTVLPSLLDLKPISPKMLFNQPERHYISIFQNLIKKHALAICAVGLVLGLSALPFLPRLTFDSNPLTLKDQTTESVSAFNELLSHPETSPWTIMVIAQNGEAARECEVRLKEVKAVDKTLILDDFIPDKQGEKLAIIKNISLILGPELFQGKRKAPPKDIENLSVLIDFQSKLKSLLETREEGPLTASGRSLQDRISTFIKALQTRTQESQRHLLNNLETSLLGSLPGRLQTLQASLTPSRITLHNLPKSLVERWKAKDGRYRIEIFPAENLNDEEALGRFVDAVRRVAPEPTGFPVIILEAGKAVITAFKQASLWSLIAIIVGLFFLLPQKTDVVLALLPLALAWALTGAIMVLFHIQFNFTNVIDLPLLLSYGANSGIYMIYRVRAKTLSDQSILQTSTTRAVVFCALTTFASFANLSVSHHPGLSSMGRLLTIGLGLILFCDLIILPALLQLRGNKP
jgi:hopanoid biosynthesis associated RND transporter like protein HpnN